MISPALQKKAEEDLSLMIQCKTVSSRNHEKEDTHEFDKFHALLKKDTLCFIKSIRRLMQEETVLFFTYPAHQIRKGNPNIKQQTFLWHITM